MARNRNKNRGASTRVLNGKSRSITTTTAGHRVDTSRKPATGSYKPIPHIWFQHPVDLPPFSFATVRAMLMDEGIRLNFETRAAPIYGLQFGWEENGTWQEGIKCRDPGVAAFIYRQLQRIWKTFLPDILRSQIWGWSGGEITLKLSEETGLIEINEMLSRHPMDIKLLKTDCERWGVRVERIEGGSIDLPFPYAWFHSYAAEDGEDYGVSAAYGAYSSWADKWFEGGAKDVRRLFMHKDAYGGVDLTYPDGETYIQGYENPIPNRDLARQIVESVRSGGVTTRPSSRDENGNEQWTLTRATVTSNPTHILEYPKDLDAEIRHGMGICDDVINSDSTGAWAGKKIPMQSFYATLDSWVTKLLRDLCTQVIDHLLIKNFGKKIEYETSFKPLAKQAMEQQGMGDGGDPQGTPQDMQGMQQPGGEEPGQTGIPGANDQPQPQPQQPVGMSLAEQVGRGDVDAKELISRAKQLALIRLSSATDASEDEEYEYTPERIEALAEILASVYGDKAEEVLDKILPEDKPIKLAVWNPGDHPRGKGGRFIPKGTEEAYTAAKEKVDAAHSSRSPESMGDLMGHLNTLTTKQLHQLKKDYGTKASAKTKSALIAKLSERLISGKHRTAERDNGTPVAPVRENVYTVPTDTLQVDPTRFQYKVKGIGAKGVGEELKGTKQWNPELGGVLLVWRDPADGNDYVVNGHHRHELASRAGAESLNVRYVNAGTAKHARSIGALANIAEGRGSAIDAAKYLRDSGQSIEHFKDAGISMSGKVASDASNLVDLSDKSFAAVAQGKMDEDKAVAVAKHLKDHSLQDKLFKKIWDREDDGKDWSSREIEAASKKMARAGSVTDSGSDLFGDWETEESTFDQEVEIESYINKALATEANDFAAVSSSRRAERVKESGNVLNVESNLQRRDSARSSLVDFEREAGLKGPISEAIKTQAAKLAKATKKADREAIKKSSLEDVRKLIADIQEPEVEPGIKLETRTNDQAKAGDQLGMFGEVANVPGGKATLDNVGESRGVAQGLFETMGDPDQMLLFDDGVATPDRMSDEAKAARLADEAKAARPAWMQKMIDRNKKIFESDEDKFGDSEAKPKALPKREKPIFAVMTADGNIHYDTSATMHYDVVEKTGLDSSEVIDGGYIIDGKYKDGMSDGGYAAHESGDDDVISKVAYHTKRWNDHQQQSKRNNYAIAMSLVRGDVTVDDLKLTAEEASEVASEVRKILKLGDNDQENVLTMSLRRMSLDKGGHEHKGKGKGGGQFVSKGGGGGGLSESKASKGDTSSDSKQSPKPAPNSPSGKGTTASQPKADAHAVAKGSEAKPAKNDIPGTDIDEEQITPPPPGKAFQVDVEQTGPDGVGITARVGLPGRAVAPPPPIPKLPNLTKHERAVESTFMEAFTKDPDGMAQKYRELIGKTSKPYTFETDQAKMLSEDWMDDDLDTQMKKRQLHNNALHQTANAIVKRAFLQHLNTMQPGDNVLVTVGGCGSGKGYTLKNTEIGKNLTSESKAVWDSAGDQNATENPWILEEATKRGLNVTYAYVAGDPKVSWADPGRGVVKRAHDNSDGRMVDAAVFADSYALGAKNHHAFHQANKENSNAKFLFFSAKDQSTLDGVPPESLNMDRKSLYHWAMGSIQSRTDVSPSVMRGGTSGARIWNEELGS